MEFKQRVHKRQKQQKARNKHEAGMIRVKVRGRKRWIKPKSRQRDSADA